MNLSQFFVSLSDLKQLLVQVIIVTLQLCLPAKVLLLVNGVGFVECCQEVMYLSALMSLKKTEPQDRVLMLLNKTVELHLAGLKV